MRRSMAEPARTLLDGSDVRAPTAAGEPVLRSFGRFVAGLGPGDVPDLALRAARLQVLDMVAAVHAAEHSGDTASIHAGLGALCERGGRATVLATGARHAPHDAAFANAACSMAQDYDDVVWMGHTCHSAVFAALAVAEHEGRDGAELLRAVVAANEVGGRLGATCLLGPLNGQMWTFVHLVSAAAATASLLRLDAEQTTHALAIALAQPNFPLQPGFLVPTSKLLAAAIPTATGIQAAYLARAGMTGDPGIVEDRRGFWARFSYLPLRPLAGDLGRFWTMQTLAIKTFPGCHYFQTACSALRRILERTGPVAVDRIRSVRIETNKLALEATRFAGEHAGHVGRVEPVNVSFDLGLTVGVMLLAGRFTGAEATRAWLDGHASELLELRRRIHVQHSPELTLKTIASLTQLGAARRALAAVRPHEALGLLRRYRTEYRSELVTPAEVFAWIRALSKTSRRRGGRGRAGENGAAPGALPMYFPNRVTVELTDGTVESAREDLPEGSLGCADVEARLYDKVLGECSDRLGADGAARVFDVGMQLGDPDDGRCTIPSDLVLAAARA